MLDAILNLPLRSGWFPIVTLWLSAALVVVVLFRRRSRRHWMFLFTITVFAWASGWLLSWFLSEIVELYGVHLPATVHNWIGLTFAAIAVGVNAICERGRWHRTLAIILVVIAPLAGAVQVNIVYGQYTIVRTLFGISSYSDIDASLLRTATFTVPAGETLSEAWTAPADMPSTGEVYSVSIPGTVSGFSARNATVYLPPAALTANPPALPVLIVMSGQPGTPDDWFLAGHLTTILNEIAAENNGLAPIVVSPDQIGAPYANPMCVDGTLGNAATYLSVDVRNWILQNLPTSSLPQDWTISGFSSGATCAVQLGAAHPDLFGIMVPIASELKPANGSVQHTIDIGFNGDADAYAAAAPIAVIQANAPSSQILIAGAGANDSVFSGYAQQIVQAAQDAGMQASFISSPGTAHDWYTVQYVISKAMPTILKQAGIGSSG